MTREQMINHLSNELLAIRAKLDMACIDAESLGLKNITPQLSTAFNEIMIADDNLSNYIARMTHYETPVSIYGETQSERLLRKYS